MAEADGSLCIHAAQMFGDGFSRTLVACFLLSCILLAAILLRFRSVLAHRKAVVLHHASIGFAGARSARLVARTKALHQFPVSPAAVVLGGFGSTIVLNACRRRRPITWTRAHDVRLPDGGLLRLRLLLHDVHAALALGTLVIFPGTRGTADSPYVTALARAAFSRGWDVVAAPLRGCGLDGPIATPMCLDGVHWTDVFHVVQALQALLPSSPGDPRRRLCAVGFSMGGGMLAHYVSETGAACPLTAAVAVSTTADWEAATRHMSESPFGWIAQRVLVGLMQASGCWSMVATRSPGVKKHGVLECMEWCASD